MSFLANKGLVTTAIGLVAKSIGDVMTIGAWDDNPGVSIVVLDPTVPYSPTGVLPVLVQKTFSVNGCVEQIERLFLDTARNKANVCWRTGKDTLEVVHLHPCLLLGGDTKWPGGIVRGGLAVAVSGLKWEYDVLVAEMVAASIHAHVASVMRAIHADKDRSVL